MPEVPLYPVKRTQAQTPHRLWPLPSCLPPWKAKPENMYVNGETRLKF